MSNKPQMRTIAGLATARGFAAGPVFVYRDGDIPIPEYAIEEKCVGDELLRLKRALGETRRDLESLVAVLRERGSRDDYKVFECHLMLLEDPVLLDETERHIGVDRINAEAAVRLTARSARNQFERMNDPYFRERVRDLDDIERRLQKALTGFCSNPCLGLKSPSIVVADDLTPSEAVQLPREFLLGFATNKGSATSHVALLARAMGVPAVTGLGNVTELVKAGELVLLDGTNGAITLSPDQAAIFEFRDLIERQRELVEAAASGAPVGTLREGGEVRIFANVHPGVPIGGIRECGARGIGLYRSEYLWIGQEREPTEEEQFEAYRDAARFSMQLGDASSITIRMLDIGGDKVIGGISGKEANPFLGNRSIRYLLSNRETFRIQLRAILRASVFGRVRLMYPLVSCVDELRESAQLLEDVKRRLDEDGVEYDRDIKVGAMIEVPAAAIVADTMAKYVDFFSIGTNDLVQYVMAADRGNDAVAHLYQPMCPAVLKLMRNVIGAAKRRGIPVSVCGESASDPLAGVLWAAMGADELSMSATYIPVMAKLLSRLSRRDLDDYRMMVDGLGDDISSDEVVACCQRWMERMIPDIGNIVV